MASFYFVQAESEQREIGINASYWRISGCGGGHFVLGIYFQEIHHVAVASRVRLLPHNSVFMWGDATVWQDHISLPLATVLSGSLEIHPCAVVISRWVGNVDFSVWDLPNWPFLWQSNSVKAVRTSHVIQREIKTYLGLMLAAGVSQWAFRYCLADCSLNCLKVRSEVKLLSRVRLCDHVDYNLLGFSICSIFEARMLEWVAISFSRGSSGARDRTQVSCIVGRHFTVWATRGMWLKVRNASPNITACRIRGLPDPRAPQRWVSAQS